MKKKILIIAKKSSDHLSLHDRIDRLICHPMIGIPLFLLTVFLIFFLAFSIPGEYLTVLLEKLFIQIAEIFRSFLFRIHTDEWLIDLLIDGIFLGVTSVICFLPQTMILFFMLSLLTESGYMARAVFVMDMILRSSGLSGKVISPFLSAFGCTVPAIEKTKELSFYEKEIIIRSLIYIPCSARLPTLLFLVSECFETYPALAASCFYILCFFATFLSIHIDTKKQKNREMEPLILSLPDYQIPCLRILFRETAEKCKDFLIRACTIIFLCSTLLHLLSILIQKFHIILSGKEAILIALLIGFFAKESIITTLKLLLPTGITSVLSISGAISFCAFAMLYVPCFSTLQMIGKELGWKKAVLISVRTFLIAFLISSILYTFTYLCLNCCAM